MGSLLKLPGIAMALFIATNIDDALMLVGFFSDPAYRTREIVLGEYAGIAALVALSAAASLLSFFIPQHYLGLLGLLPLILGVKRFAELFRPHSDTAQTAPSSPAWAGHGRIATVALVTLANGGDNLGVYTPVFATCSPSAIAIIVVMFVLLTALWCLLAHELVHHPKLGIPVRACGRLLAPLVLIALGVMVLHQSGSLALLAALLKKLSG